MDRGSLAEQIVKLRGAKILCVGDVMLDRFIYGEVGRISPEAPVPICRVTQEFSMLGGAGNVARNLAALGAKVSFVAIIGSDVAGKEIKAQLEFLEDVEVTLIADKSRPTTIKERFIGGVQQLLRVDRETTEAPPAAIERRLCKTAEKLISTVSAVVLSDYDKGTLSRETVDALIAAARKAGKPVIVDPKGEDYGWYAGAQLITPNAAELALATRMDTEGAAAVVAAARSLQQRCRIDNILVTRSAEGMTLVGPGEPQHFPAEAQEVFDVSGAGDTVVATLAAGLAGGIRLPDAVGLANVAAGIVVGKVGTAVATDADVLESLRQQELRYSPEQKVMTLDDAITTVGAWRDAGEKVGFTNGCFDLIHPGHVTMLSRSRAECDRLVVGLNADSSVRRLKGRTRPIQNESSRATVLASLESVDLVVLFSQDTPIKLIKALRPQVLTKGADYAMDEVVGGDIVTRYGGEVRLINLEPGHSTTATVEKISES